MEKWSLKILKIVSFFFLEHSSILERHKGKEINTILNEDELLIPIERILTVHFFHLIQIWNNVFELISRFHSGSTINLLTRLRLLLFIITHSSVFSINKTPTIYSSLHPNLSTTISHFALYLSLHQAELQPKSLHTILSILDMASFFVLRYSLSSSCPTWLICSVSRVACAVLKANIAWRRLKGNL